MILSFVFFVFIFYLGFKLLFNFIIPIYKTTRQVRRQFKNMQSGMNGQQAQPTGTKDGKPADLKKDKAPASDYIDFEEVKD